MFLVVGKIFPLSFIHIGEVYCETTQGSRGKHNGAVHLGQCFVERQVRSFLVGWHASGVTLPPGDIIFAQLV